MDKNSITKDFTFTFAGGLFKGALSPDNENLAAAILAAIDIS